ncbi:MAG: hypothetical protein Q8R76_04240 [Candidatus Omnitrophota bacterium]|nr:hypothetical protein [Candidatus Omnitrophota bacterium]
MTYERLFNLKYKQGVSTYELIQRFPNDAERVREVALLDVPEATLKEIIRDEKIISRLIRLKRQLFGGPTKH